MQTNIGKHETTMLDGENWRHKGGGAWMNINKTSAERDR